MYKKTIIALMLAFSLCLGCACTKDNAGDTAKPDSDAPNTESSADLNTEQNGGSEIAGDNSAPQSNSAPSDSVGNNNTSPDTPVSNDAPVSNDNPVSNEKQDGGASEPGFEGTEGGESKPADKNETVVEPTDPDDPKQPEEETPTAPDTPAAPPSPDKCTYEMYQNMTGYEQKAFLESFPSVADFFDWYHAAKDKYDKQNPEIEIGDGPITIG